MWLGPPVGAKSQSITAKTDFISLRLTSHSLHISQYNGCQVQASKEIARRVGLGHSLIQNHPFVDGNKRVGHGAMEVFLLLNGHEIEASVDEQEQIIIGVASGKVSRMELSEWLHEHTV